MSENIAKYNVVLELITQQKGDIKKIDKEVVGLQKTMNNAKKAFIGLFAVAAVSEMGRQIFDVTAKYQQYDTILTNSLGSQEKAAAAMDLIKKIGKESVFSVDEMTSSYIKFINRGIKPTQDQFVAFTDLAASQGKSIDDLTEAVLDATTGEFERLKEFGIKANKEGDKIKLSFKGQAIEVNNTASAINDALVGFGKLPGVMGSNAVQMETLNGKMSLIKDSVDELFLKIGNALLPVFEGLLIIVSYLVAGLGSFFDVIVAIPKFIKENATALKLLGLALITLNTNLIITTTQLLASTAAANGKAIADLFLARSTGVLTKAQKLLNTAFKANPVGLLITGILLLASGMVTLYNKSETVRNVFAGLTKIFKGAIDYLTSIPKEIVKAFDGGLVSGFKKISEKALDLITTIINPIKLAKKIFKVGKSIGSEFKKGFEENANLESLTRRSKARGGSRSLADIGKVNDEQRQKRIEREKKDDDERKANNENRKKALEARIKKELELINAEFEKKEINAKKTIDNEKKLNEELDKLTLQRQIALAEANLKYAKGLEALELENAIIDLKKKLQQTLRKNDLGGLIVSEIIGGFERAFRTEDGVKRLNSVLKEVVEGLTQQYNIDGSIKGTDINLLASFFTDPDGKIADQGQKNVKSIAERMQKTLEDNVANSGKKDKPWLQTLLGLNDDQFNKFKSDLQRAEDLIKQSANAILENEIAVTDARIKLQENRVSRAENIAERGNVKVLELEEERLNKLQEKRERYARQQRVIEQAQIIGANAVAAAKSIQAITSAFAIGGPAGIFTGIATSVALAAQIAAIISTVNSSFGDIPNFWEGTELISQDPRYKAMKIHQGRDGYVARLDGTERVVDGGTNAKLDGFPNHKLPDAVALYKLLPHVNLSNVKNAATKEILEVKQAINNLTEVVEAMQMEVSLDVNGFLAKQEKMIQKKIERKRYVS